MKTGKPTHKAPSQPVVDLDRELGTLLLDIPAFLVAVLDEKNTLVRSSDSLQRISSALQGQPLERFVSPEQTTGLLDRLARARLDRQPQTVEFTLKAPDSPPRPMQWTIRSLASQPGWLLAAGVEINQPEQTKPGELAATDMQTLLTEVVESTPDVVAILRADERLVYLNWAARELLGVNENNLTHSSLHDLRPQWVVELIQREGFPGAVRDGYWSGEAALLSVNGEEVPVSLVIVAHSSPEGEVEHFSLVARDIREARQMQADLRQARDELGQIVAERTAELDESRQMLQLILDNIPQRVFWKDHNLRYLGANRPFLQDSGLERIDQLIGKEDYDLSWKELAELYRADDRQVLQSRQPKINYEEPLPPQDGEDHWVRTSKIPLSSSQGEIFGILGTYEDITLIKRAQEMLKQKNEELTRSNAELEQFAYIASHDLQEPLRMVASFAQLLARRYQGTLDERGEKYIGYIVEGAFRMQALINDLLTYSRVDTRGHPFVSVDCVRSVEQALFNLQVAIREAGARVDVGMLPTIQADETQINQLFQNLIGNAIKFRSNEPAEVRVWAERDGADWRFAVRDNGIGIEAQYAERIFVIFQRLHGREQYPGTGIGLAVCKKIVQRHGGKIWFESTPGKGSTFFFTIPDAEEIIG